MHFRTKCFSINRSVTLMNIFCFSSYLRKNNFKINTFIVFFRLHWWNLFRPPRHVLISFAHLVRLYPCFNKVQVSNAICFSSYLRTNTFKINTFIVFFHLHWWNLFRPPRRVLISFAHLVRLYPVSTGCRVQCLILNYCLQGLLINAVAYIKPEAWSRVR